MNGKKKLSKREKDILHAHYNSDNDTISSEFSEIAHDKNIKSAVERELWHIWNNESDTQDVQGWDVDSRLAQLHHELNLREAKRRARFGRLMTNFSKIAAILFIPLMISSLFLSYKILENKVGLLSSSRIELNANAGSKTSFSLPDGTTGWLNSNSKLSYRTGFTKGRTVQLSGEAYFEVTHKKNKPFQVKTNQGTVEVLGTKFDVISYPKKDFKVILSEGKVKCKINNTNIEEYLNPNEMLKYSETTGLRTITKVVAQHYTSWTQDKLILRDVSLIDLLDRISQWYDVDVEIIDEELLEYTFWGVFSNESIESILDLLKITSPIKYEVIERKMKPDHTFTQKKIKLYYDDNWKPETIGNE